MTMRRRLFWWAFIAAEIAIFALAHSWEVL